MKTLLLCLLTTIAGVAKSQPLFLYESIGEPTKFILTRSYQEGNKVRVSEVIMSDTFQIQVAGAMCQVILSNAFVYQTRIDRTFTAHSTNGAVQMRFTSREMKMFFAKETELIFDNSIMELWQAQLGHVRKAKPEVRSYEGDAALQQLKKMGLKVPGDVDERK
jgi:hypothetical protein